MCILQMPWEQLRIISFKGFACCKLVAIGVGVLSLNPACASTFAELFVQVYIRSVDIFFVYKVVASAESVIHPPSA